MSVLRNLLPLALWLPLATAPGHARDTEECPHPERWRPSPEELQAKLLAHKEWVENRGWLDPAVPGRAVLCNADVRDADLGGAILVRANLTGADLSKANLEGASLVGADLGGAVLYGAWLRAAVLREADLGGANLSQATIEGADLFAANLQGADLRFPNLQGANLDEANLEGAYMIGANLKGAYLRANLVGANLFGASLKGADLSEAKVTNAQLAYADLTDALYAPASAPPNEYLAGIRGLETVVVPRSGDIIGLVQLRELLQKTGLRDPERAATHAIERNKTRHLLFGEIQHDVRPQEIAGRGTLKWGDPLALAEGVIRLVAFEWPVAYGLHPGRALLILLASIGVFAVAYIVPLATAAGRIYRVWPEGRIEELSDAARLAREAEVERLRPRGPLKVLGRALQFSVLSAFHLGWRELNVGTWLARVQTREYTLRATGWVRAVAGVQSLLSVYLLALWALTYFGRPFQ